MLAVKFKHERVNVRMSGHIHEKATCWKHKLLLQRNNYRCYASMIINRLRHCPTKRISYADLHVAYGEQIIMILNLTFANLNADGGLPSYGREGELLNRVLFDSTGVKGLFVSKERREDLASETMFALV